MPSADSPARPMSLGNMRSLGPHSLDVTCGACGYHTTFNVDAWPDEVLVQSFEPRMQCGQCGHQGANVRP
jgi:ribosomal protein S27AE